MKGWKEYTFNDAVECNPKVSITKGEVVENCEMEDIKPNYKYLYPREGKLYKGSNSKFQNGDTVFARITPCLENGKIAQIKRLKKNAGIGSTEFFVFRGKKNISDSDFVFYLSKTNVVRDTAVNSMTGASGRQRADIKAVKKISLQLPPLSTQQRIASILSAYDDLIEVNNQRIKLLEQTARELYKEWFVRMRFPATAGSRGYKKAKFKKGVPEGWRIVRIGEVIKIKNGKQVILNDNGNYKVYGSNGRIGYSNDFNYENVLVIGRVGAYCGSVEIGNDKIWATDNTLIAIPNNEKVGFYYSYYLLKIFDLGNFASGSAQPLLTQSIINSFEIKSPPKELIRKYESIAHPIFQQIEFLQQQNIQLRQIRDRLLPRLISGKLKVSELRFV